MHSFLFSSSIKVFFSIALCVFSFLAALLVTPQTKPMLVQTTLNMLLYKKRKFSAFKEEEKIVQIFYNVWFSWHAVLCCRSFSFFSYVRNMWVIVDPAPTLNQLAGNQNFSPIVQKLFTPAQKERELSCYPVCRQFVTLQIDWENASTPIRRYLFRKKCEMIVVWSTSTASGITVGSTFSNLQKDFCDFSGFYNTKTDWCGILLR